MSNKREAVDLATSAVTSICVGTSAPSTIVPGGTCWPIFMSSSLAVKEQPVDLLAKGEFGTLAHHKI